MLKNGVFSHQAGRRTERRIGSGRNLVCCRRLRSECHVKSEVMIRSFTSETLARQNTLAPVTRNLDSNLLSWTNRFPVVALTRDAFSFPERSRVGRIYQRNIRDGTFGLEHLGLLPSCLRVSCSTASSEALRFTAVRSRHLWLTMNIPAPLRQILKLWLFYR
ncbi:hypothetical protein TNIN_322461 [Trichonephila inaurata madagascariensis]|uniref:Uncharacterized protein n=1 Tax=Trichonephila inaurata madagascariensis TaxID=2747483 RepID=A0A8X6YH82_9ARAC|nr:hypothetical protein TNIN_322461 [Trichonephila inaurata madagascariensis]